MIFISMLLFIIFLIWTILLFQGKIITLDNNFYNQIKIDDKKTKIFKTITFLANAKFMLFVCLIIFFIAELPMFLTIIINLVLTWSITGIFKYIFKRERPTKRPLVHEKGYSYPSGHTMVATTFYGFSIFLVAMSEFILALKALLIIIYVSLIFLVGYTRIYLGVHYYSDIVGGLLLGSSYLMLFVYFTHFGLNFI